MDYAFYIGFGLIIIYMCFHIEIRKFFTWFQPNCPNCTHELYQPKLYKNGKHHFPENPNMENIKPLYTCEKCKVEFISLG